MIFRDDFSVPTQNWRRGAVVLSSAAGPVAMRSRDDISYAVLSGTAVHPANLARFKAEFIWSFGEGDGAAIAIMLGKPNEWSSHDKSAVKIQISKTFESVVTTGNGMPIGTALLTPSQTEYPSVSLAVAQGKLILNGGQVEFDVPGLGEAGGYLTFRTINERVILRGFSLEFESDIPPMTEAERDAEIYEWMHAGMDKSRAHLDALKKYSREHPDPYGFCGVDMRLSRGLVRAGSTVTVEFHGGSGAAPAGAGESGKVTLEPCYLSSRRPEPVTLKPDWRRSEPGGEWVARTDILADRPGNWRVTWEVNDTRLSRVFGVTTDNCVVATLWCGCNYPVIDEEIHRFGLPGDHWFGPFFGGSPEAVVEDCRAQITRRHMFGDRLVPFVNADALIPGIPNTNLMSMPLELQGEGLAMVREMWELIGAGPLEILGSYTFAHATTGILNKLGIKAFNSLCIWQNWRDGSDNNSWKIDHWGAPNAPYYAAPDDFRKAGAAGGAVGFSMGTASSTRNYSIFTMESCPTLTCPTRRYTGDLVQNMNMTRFYDAVEGWLNDARYQREPVFVTIALENFLSRADWAASNKMAVEYLVRRAGSEPLVFASAADIADFYADNYPGQPEMLLYQPDIYCGYRANAKPAQIGDRIETSNARFHTVHTEGRALPQFFWDYTRPWNEPEWDPQPDIRNKFGLITPEDLAGRESVPLQADLSGVTASVAIESAPDGGRGAKLIVSVSSPRSMAFLPLAAWRIPLDPRTCALSDAPSPGARFVPVADGFTGNLHALIELSDVPAGDSETVITLSGDARAPVSANFAAGPHFRGRAIKTPEGYRSYLWLADGVTAAEDAPLELRLRPANKRAAVYYNDGSSSRPDEATGELVIRFDGTWRTEAPVVEGEDLRLTAPAASCVWPF